MSIGFFELVLLFVIALLILGPQRMMVVARHSGLLIRRGRAIYRRVMDELDQQLRLDEMNRHSKSSDRSAHNKKAK